MHTPIVLLVSVSNKHEYLTYGLFSLKTYVLQYIQERPKPHILIQIYKAKNHFEKDNTSVKVSLKEIDQIANRIVKKNPYIVGFSCNVVNRKATIRIIKRVKTLNPQIIIIVGGPETHQYLFHNYVSLMQKVKGIDVIVKFDGEQILLELLECFIYKKRSLNKIRGIVYRNGSKVINNKNGPPLNLQKLPSPYLHNAIEIRSTNKEQVVENSRGCPYRCAYCSYPMGNNQFLRYFPNERIKKELIFLLKKKVKYIYISDNNFNINEKQAYEIMKTISAHNKNNYTKISVSYNASREPITEAMLQMLSLSKINITIGVQTTNKKTLKIARRQDNLKILETNLKLMDKHNVQYRLEFIYGLPGDSYHDIKKNINWLFQFKAQWVFFYRLVIIPGTEFFKQATELGLVYDTTIPGKVVRSNTLTSEDIMRIEKLLTFVFLFYNNLKLRKNIYHVHNIFRLRYSQIFEIISNWYKGSKKKLYEPNYIDKISKDFSNYLLSYNIK